MMSEMVRPPMRFECVIFIFGGKGHVMYPEIPSHSNFNAVTTSSP